MPSFGSIGAGLANMYPGAVAGRQKEAEAVVAEMTAQNAQESQQADVLRGNALMHLFAGGQPGGPQPPMPGQPSMPMAPPMGPGAGPQMASMGGGVPGPVTAPQPPGPPPTPAQGLASPPPAGEQQLNGVGEQNGKPTIGGGVPSGLLTWHAIGNAIAKANPGAPPQLIAKAIDRFVPMMTQDSQLQWRLLKMQQDEKLLGVKQEHQDARSENRNRTQLTMAEMRNNVAQQNADTKKNAMVNWTPENRMALERVKGEERLRIAEFTQGKLDDRQSQKLMQTDAWKQMDDDTKHKLLDARLDAQRELEGVRQEGANTRAAGAQEGANRRNATAVAGANQRAEGRNTTTLDVARQRNELAKWIADGKPITAAQARISEKSQTYDSAISTIDQAVQDVATGHKEGKNVVGLVGKARGIAEIAGNIGGWNDETRRAAFEQKIATLLNTVPRLLTGSALTNKDERARMGQIVQGLTPGSTKQATFHDLVWLKGKLEELKPKLGANTNQGDIRASRNAAPAEPKAAELAPMTPAAKSAMDAALADGHSRAEVEKMLRAKGFDPASDVAATPPAPAEIPARNSYGGSR